MSNDVCETGKDSNVFKLDAEFLLNNHYDLVCYKDPFQDYGIAYIIYLKLV